MRSSRKQANTRAESLTVGFGVLRLIKQDTPDLPRASSLASANPALAKSLQADIDSRYSSFPGVQKFVEDAICSGYDS